MPCDWNTGIYPRTRGGYWLDSQHWTDTQHATAKMAIHESGHARIAQVLGGSNISIEITGTNAANQGHTRFAHSDNDAVLLIAAAGQQADLAWWQHFQDAYNPDVDVENRLLALCDPFAYSSGDQALLDRLPTSRRYRHLYEVEEDAAGLVADHMDDIVSIAEQVIAGRGQWSA